MSKRKSNTQKTAAFKMQMHEGARIANQLPQFMSLEQVAKKLGISYQMVRRIECLALFKVKTRLQEALRNE